MSEANNKTASLEEMGSAKSGNPASVEPVRVAVIGCGAIAEQFHLPVLAGHERVKLTAMVDRDQKRAESLATAYGVESVLTDSADLTPELADAAVICTPPAHHAPCSIDLLKRGLHVLVEKPMATSLADAEAMVAAADAAQRVLSVGVFRRLLPSLRMLKAAIDDEFMGPPTGFVLEGGSIYGWEAATLGNMLKSQAGGGVLMDMAPHYFDQLLYLFPGDAEVIEYRDNALGGIETDCDLRLRCRWNDREVEGRIVLSRTKNLANELRVQCERGELAIPPSERYRVHVRPAGMQLRDPRTGEAAETVTELSWKDEPDTPWLANLREEVDDWVDAIGQQVAPKLSGRSVLPVMRLIDDCYRQASQLEELWAPHPLINQPHQSVETAKAAEPARPSEAAKRTVLVTGASGFIGCRVAEILSQRDGYVVRAMVRNPANASRIARLNVELVQGDLNNRADMDRVLSGCDEVVHCAVGTDYWDPKAVRRVTVEGTKTLLDAAAAAQIRRLVHLSTIAVHSADQSGRLTSKTPAKPASNDNYGLTKLEAERAVLTSPTPAVVLRPGCVYGPFGKTFITNPITHLVDGRLCLEDAEDSPSNTVYVDNLVEAIVRALESEPEVTGKIFPLADDDGMTWGEFYGYFAERIGTPYQVASAVSEGSVANGKPRGVFGAVRNLVVSAEMQALVSKAMWTDPIGSLPRSLLDRSPGLKRRMKSLLGMQQAATYTHPTGADAPPLRITARAGVIDSSEARDVLGWGPLLGRRDCLHRTWAWLEASQIVPAEVRSEEPLLATDQ